MAREARAVESGADQNLAGEPLTTGAVALTLLTAALWGGTAVAVSYSVDTLPPLAVAAIRFSLAAAFMLVWCRFEGSSLRLSSPQVVPAVLTGTLMALQIGTFNWGLQLSNASHGTLLINTYVFWVVALEHLVTGGERASRRRILGLVLAAASVAFMMPASGTKADPDVVPDRPRSASESPGLGSDTAGQLGDTPGQLGDTSGQVGDTPSLAGDAILVLSAVLLAIRIVYARYALRVMEPGKLIFWHDVVGVGWFLLGSLLLESPRWEAVGMPAVLGLLYQGVVVAGLCFAIQATLLKRYAASQISVFSFTTPLFGVVIAVTLRGDPLSPWLLVSAAGVAAGIWLVTVRGK